MEEITLKSQEVHVNDNGSVGFDLDWEHNDGYIIATGIAYHYYISGVDSDTGRHLHTIGKGIEFDAVEVYDRYGVQHIASTEIVKAVRAAIVVC